MWAHDDTRSFKTESTWSETSHNANEKSPPEWYNVKRGYTIKPDAWVEPEEGRNENIAIMSGKSQSPSTFMRCFVVIVCVVLVSVVIGLCVFLLKGPPESQITEGQGDGNTGGGAGGGSHHSDPVIVMQAYTQRYYGRNIENMNDVEREKFEILLASYTEYYTTGAKEGEPGWVTTKCKIKKQFLHSFNSPQIDEDYTYRKLQQNDERNYLEVGFMMVYGSSVTDVKQKELPRKFHEFLNSVTGKLFLKQGLIRLGMDVEYLGDLYLEGLDTDGTDNSKSPTSSPVTFPPTSFPTPLSTIPPTTRPFTAFPTPFPTISPTRRKVFPTNPPTFNFKWTEWPTFPPDDKTCHELGDLFCGQIKDKKGRCLDMRTGGDEKGNVVVNDCKRVNNQKWYYNTVTLQIKNGWDGDCLDWDFGDSRDLGEKNVYVNGDCHGRENQQWVQRGDNFIEILDKRDGRKCLQYDGDDGNLEIRDCDRMSKRRSKQHFFPDPRCFWGVDSRK